MVKNLLETFDNKYSNKRYLIGTIEDKNVKDGWIREFRLKEIKSKPSEAKTAFISCENSALPALVLTKGDFVMVVAYSDTESTYCDGTYLSLVNNSTKIVYDINSDIDDGRELLSWDKVEDDFMR